jgi:hypothetical protein
MPRAPKLAGIIMVDITRITNKLGRTERKQMISDKTLAGFCANCLLCRRARQRQRGAAFWLVKHVEARLCPFCRAYERVYGRKAHEGGLPKDPHIQDTK